MKTETELYDWLKYHVPGDWRRIETTTGSGYPDTNVCYRGREVWVELKVVRKLKTPYFKNAVELLRAQQSAWMSLRKAHGGRCFIAVGQPGKIFFIPYPNNHRTVIPVSLEDTGSAVNSIQAILFQ